MERRLDWGDPTGGNSEASLGAPGDGPPLSFSPAKERSSNGTANKGPAAGECEESGSDTQAGLRKAKRVAAKKLS
jgi:hypothetical protein